MATEKATYSHGHHSSVVNLHARRTAENCAAFLLPHIKQHDRILDVGSGPGSITIGLARYASGGHVVGGDMVAEVVARAERLARERGVPNVSFQPIDANALPFADGSFDLTFCHQVLQHVGDPVAVLREMKRVTKPGGLVAAREADGRGFVCHPEPEPLARWGRMYQEIGKGNGAEPNAGRYLRTWAKEAGFDSRTVEFSWQAWNIQGEEANWWGRAWADRVRYSGFADGARKFGLVKGDGKEELEAVAQAWLKWAEDEDAFIMVPNGEILCKV